MLPKKIILSAMIAVTSFIQAEFLLQSSFSVRMYDSVARMSGYNVQYDNKAVSPYDVSLGYMLSFKDVVVMPVMLEAKNTTFESYLNTSEIAPDQIAPLEMLFKPGLRLIDTDVYMILGYQLGDFKQHIGNTHQFELAVKPNFYGVGYTRMLSEYLDYLAEVKVYYQSEKSYGLDFSNRTLDADLTILDARVRVGFRVKI